MPAAHRRLPASGAKRWANCPGALALIARLPPDVRDSGGRAAHLGTAAAFLLEEALRGGHEDLVAFKGKRIEVFILRDMNGNKTEGNTRWFVEDAAFTEGWEFVLQNSFEVDDKMMDGVSVCLDYVISRMSAMDSPQLLLEQSGDLASRGWADVGGSFDICLDEFMGELETIDYKNGRVIVDIEDPTDGSFNYQLMIYLLCKAIETEWSHETYSITVIQPNAWHIDGPVRTRSVTAEQLKEFADKIVKAAETVDEANDMLLLIMDPEAKGSMTTDEWVERYVHAGSWCDWCPKAPTCPGHHKLAGEQALADFEGEAIELELLEHNPEEIARLVPHAIALKAWCKAVMDARDDYLWAGTPVEGWKIVRPKANRAYRQSPDETAEELVTRLGVDEDDLYEPPAPRKLKSPSKVEQLRPKGWKVKDIKAIVTSLTDRGPGKPKVVTADHAAEAWDPEEETQADFEGEDL